LNQSKIGAALITKGGKVAFGAVPEQVSLKRSVGDERDRHGHRRGSGSRGGVGRDARPAARTRQPNRMLFGPATPTAGGVEQLVRSEVGPAADERPGDFEGGTALITNVGKAVPERVVSQAMDRWLA
jgi:hypothetical protein